MATTNGNGNSGENKKIRYSDIPDKNELGNLGKIMGGILLILFTLIPIFFMIALWPDEMPVKGGPQKYINHLFRMKLDGSGTLHINTIMFILVALAGFTGNMIHIATSFTNYVGAEKFKRT